MIEYRGYKIQTNTKTITTKNPFSGYIWAYQVPIKGYYIAGPGAKVCQIFNNLHTAKEHIDFIIKFLIKDSANEG